MEFPPRTDAPDCPPKPPGFPSAAISTGCAPAIPPVGSPYAVGQIEGSVEGQRLAPVTNTAHPPPPMGQFSEAPTNAATSSTNRLGPKIAEFPTPAADPKIAEFPTPAADPKIAEFPNCVPIMPGTQSLQSVTAQQSNLGIPSYDGLPLNQNLKPTKAPNPIAFVTKDATLPTHGTRNARPARPAGIPAALPAAQPFPFGCFFRTSPFA
ncbi:hypothetical protein Adt_38700 [Abeliophyllum distichum]|uniref:Uncharacterized protein n=1 Tax=Abeliophyllum distichum TaxID=126358 RepID=A0ABD1Q3Z5_9LAMI